MKYAWKKQPDAPFREGEEDVNRYGGYSSRQQYENRKEKGALWKRVLSGILLAVLISFAAVGIFAMIRGDVFPPDSEVDAKDDTTIKVPTQNELNQLIREPEKVLQDLDTALITVEAVLEDGTSRMGSGFLVSEDGYAVCSTYLFSGGAKVKEVRATAVEGISYTAYQEGIVEEMGLALIRLESNLGYSPVSVGNFSFVKRGETYYAAAANSRDFAGTALSGIVASTGSSIKVKMGENSTSVPVLFLDMTPNESIWGAPVVDLTGRVIGFCSHTARSPYGDLVGVVSIHAVYTAVNEMLGD